MSEAALHPIDQYYDNLEWFRSLATTDEGNVRAMYCVYALLDVPRFHLDLGCGTGAMLRTSKLQGASVLGVECSTFAREAAPDVPIMVGDLTDVLPMASIETGYGFADLVTCIEVAEHVLPEGNNVLLDNVARCTHKWLIFTGAVPGQGGTGHINLRPRAEWQHLLERHGLRYEAEWTEHLRLMWTWCTGGLVWLPQNVMVFSRG